MALEFFDDPAAFLAAAEPALALDPVASNVIGVVTERMARNRAAGRDTWAAVGAPFEPWWVLVRDESGEPTGAGMRTAPFAPYPTYLYRVGEDDARELARALHERGEELGGSNGMVPGAPALAEETARLTGRAVYAETLHRLWECTEVVVPPVPRGGVLRPAEAADADLVVDWFTRFHDEAAEQAGRSEAEAHHIDREDVRMRVERGLVWVWQLDSGEVVHLTANSDPAQGVARIAPVYTPKQHRGHGYASYVVAERTRRGLVAGLRMCLFTDVDNPTSNKIYEEIGYRPLMDSAYLRIE